MPKERKIGIYLGVSSIGGVLAEDKKIVASSRFDFAEEDKKSQISLDDVRLEAAINKVLRELFTEEKTIYLSLSDKDFIFRSLDMPILSKKEIEPSIAYQIQDYIPFKIEELSWAYNYNIFKKEKKMNLSFIGVKTQNIEKIKKIFSNLEKEVVFFEPASLSLLKVLKSVKKNLNVSNFAILDLKENEGYLTLFFNGLVLFNRYLIIPKKDNKIDFEKFNDSVRLSLQYAKREFSFYEIENFILFSDKNYPEISFYLKEELQKEIEVITPFDITKISSSDIDNIKALGSTLKDTHSYNFKSVKTEPLEKKISKEPVSSEPLNIPLFITIILIGVFFLIVMFAILESKTFTERVNIKKYEDSIFDFSSLSEYKKNSLDELNEIYNKEEDKLKVLEKLSPKINIKEFFVKIATFLPEGFTLESIELNYTQEKYTATIYGYCYLSSPEEEAKKIDEFVFNFKKDDYIKKVFKNIDLAFLNRKKIDKFEVTYFLIKFE